MSMTVKQHVDYWLAGSAEDMKVMRDNIKLKHMTHALFFGHLAIEKMLKAVCAVRRIQVPVHGSTGHNLPFIAAQCELVLTTRQITELTTIKAFNIAARYDDYKSRFHKTCTPQYVKEWSSKIKWWYKYLKTIVERERSALPNNSPM